MQWSKVLLFVYLGLLISYVRGESQTGIVTDDLAQKKMDRRIARSLSA